MEKFKLFSGMVLIEAALVFYTETIVCKIWGKVNE